MQRFLSCERTGAYAEDLGNDLSMYDDIYQQLGKWEWDLVRSARLVLDVGLNYEGWTRKQALAFWHQNIRNQDDIAEREIDRMLRWPAQVISYKVGEQEILRLKKQAQDSEGEDFDIRKFHMQVLEHGSLPLDVLRSKVHARFK